MKCLIKAFIYSRPRNKESEQELKMDDDDHLRCEENLDDFEDFSFLEDGNEDEEDDQNEPKLIENIAEGENGDDEEGFVIMMISKEMNFKTLLDSNDDRNKRLRSEAISWISRTATMLAFRLQTMYVSIAYFDRFLTQRSFQDEEIGQVKLVSTACLSLAAKMEETNAPFLTRYNLDTESLRIRRMEILVFETLEWRLLIITPFHFLHYFIIQFSENSSISNQMESTSEEFVLALIKEINYMSYKPSVIAAAAALMALDQSLNRITLEARISSISSSGFLEIEDVFQCYNIIKNLQRDDSNASSITSAIGKKRRRLL